MKEALKVSNVLKGSVKQPVNCREKICCLGKNGVVSRFLNVVVRRPLRAADGTMVVLLNVGMEM